MTTNRTDWSNVERDYLAGMPMSEIRAKHGIAPVDLLKKANACGWKYGDGRSSGSAAPTSPPDEASELDHSALRAAEETVADVGSAPRGCETVPGAGANAVLDWDEGPVAYGSGLSFRALADSLDVDPRELGERAYREGWKLNLAAVLREQLGADRAERIVALIETGDVDEDHSGHSCDECGEKVERPVYCGRGCQQRAYRRRRKDRDTSEDAE